MDLNKALETAKTLAQAAGQAIMRVYTSRDFGVTEKKEDGRKSELTRADLAANDIIVQGLNAAFPDIPVLTEEEKDDKKRLKADWLWIVDPLDGTKEFILQNGEFTANIGLVHQGRPVLGAVFVPVTDELFHACQGQGAFYAKEGRPLRIHSSDRNRLSEMTLMRSRSHAAEKDRKLVESYQFGELIASGSSVKGCRVAQGLADIYYRFGPVHEWDICAMNAVLDQAGAILTDFDGNPVSYNQPKPRLPGFVASNNTLHAELVRMGRAIMAG